MLTEKKVVAKFRDRGLLEGDELYLSPEVALEFLNVAQSNQMATIGIEGFLRHDRTLEPQLDMIADFSGHHDDDWSRFLQLSHKWSKEFVAQLPKDESLVLNFTLMTKDEWKATKESS